jgi:hypothetical protein
MTNDKQQTAVEWLSQQFDSIVELYPSQFERVNRAIEQAKEMEKVKAFEIFKAGQDSTEEGGKGFEQWYNLTYGGNK